MTAFKECEEYRTNTTALDNPALFKNIIFLNTSCVKTQQELDGYKADLRKWYGDIKKVSSLCERGELAGCDEDMKKNNTKVPCMFTMYTMRPRCSVCTQ